MRQFNYNREYFYYLRGVHQKRKMLFSNSPYHIIQRAPGREQLFLEESDCLYFLRLLKETSQKFYFQIRAFCLMPNHLHLLGLSTLDNFSEAMQFLFKRYAQYFNLKYQRKGHVFHGPFRVVPIYKEYVEIIVATYIHLNPVKAHLVEDETKWKWSSIELYYYPKRKSFIDSSSVLRLISEDITQASKMYRKMIKELIGDGKIVLSTEEKRGVQSFFASSFRKFASWFKTTYLKEEYKILSQLDSMIENAKANNFARRQAYLYAIDQLSSRGFNNEFIMQLLGIPKPTFYRYLKSIHPSNH